MCTCSSKSRRKTSLQNCQIQENLLGNIEISPSRNPIFLNSFPTFFNGYLLSSTAFQFLQWFSAFFNGFPLSPTAFRFLQRLSVEGGFSFTFLFLIKKIPNNPISHKWELNSVERFYIRGCLSKSRNKNSDCLKFVGQLNGRNMCYHECLLDL